jgi:hypothetical protein
VPYNVPPDPAKTTLRDFAATAPWNTLSDPITFTSASNAGFATGDTALALGPRVDQVGEIARRQVVDHVDFMTFGE